MRRKAKAVSKPDSFPGYPQFRKVTYSEQYGRMELIEVNQTSDGFLVGQALIGEPDDEQYVHSVFLGSAQGGE